MQLTQVLAIAVLGLGSLGAARESLYPRHASPALEVRDRKRGGEVNDGKLHKLPKCRNVAPATHGGGMSEAERTRLYNTCKSTCDCPGGRIDCGNSNMSRGCALLCECPKLH